MRKVEHIEDQIRQLSREEFAELRDWVLDQDWSSWDAARLDVATMPGQMDLPGLRLHPLKGALKGYWAVSVTGNWRIIFRFDGRDAVDVDLVDYYRAWKEFGNADERASTSRSVGAL